MIHFLQYIIFKMLIPRKINFSAASKASLFSNPKTSGSPYKVFFQLLNNFFYLLWYFVISHSLFVNVLLFMWFFQLRFYDCFHSCLLIDAFILDMVLIVLSFTMVLYVIQMEFFLLVKVDIVALVMNTFVLVFVWLCVYYGFCP